MEFTNFALIHIYSFRNAEICNVMRWPDKRSLRGIPGAVGFSMLQLLVMGTIMWLVMSLPIIASIIADADMAAAQTIIVNYSVFFSCGFAGFVFNGAPIVGHYIGKGDAKKT